MAKPGSRRAFHLLPQHLLLGFPLLYFGRRYGLVIDHEKATSISAGIDGGHPWRRTFGDNITYTDWNRANYFHAVRSLVGNARRIGIEFDHVNLELMQLLKKEFPEADFVDISAPAMRLRMVKSDEEIAHITDVARIADLGGAACIEATAVGVPEHEVALHSTRTMVREIARTWPHAELMDTWTWFQSGINTDGAHNQYQPADRARGYPALNCFIVAGYYVALERTLAEIASDEHLRLWEINCAYTTAARNCWCLERSVPKSPQS